jgi:hypothetical protein
MPPPTAKPDSFLTEEHQRAPRIFARLMAGESMRVIAASQNLSLRRVQQIVREQLDRRNANPADDFALLQIARLERALDLIGDQIDAGKPSEAPCLRSDSRPSEPPCARAPASESRISTRGRRGRQDGRQARRLDAAREALAVRQASPGLRANVAKRNRPQALDKTGNRETTDSRPPMISET